MLLCVYSAATTVRCPPCCVVLCCVAFFVGALVVLLNLDLNQTRTRIRNPEPGTHEKILVVNPCGQGSPHWRVIAVPTEAFDSIHDIDYDVILM